MVGEQHQEEIGIACGPAGLLVVDLDTCRGRGGPPEWAEHGVTDGRDVLAALADRAGEPDPVDTYTVATPRGEHRYFTQPSGVGLGSTAGRLGWCVDTSGRGGFVVAAGSVRRTTSDVRRYWVIRDRPVAPLPGWLADALTPSTTPIDCPAAPAHPDAYARAAIRGEAAKVSDARLRA